MSLNLVLFFLSGLAKFWLAPWLPHDHELANSDKKRINQIWPKRHWHDGVKVIHNSTLTIIYRQIIYESCLNFPDMYVIKLWKRYAFN
jgi:hypothetical protein